jgi:type I restriction enzyme S subunit
VTEAERGWIMSSNMMWISVDQRKADPQYVQLNISSNAIVRRQIQGLVNSAGREVANAAVMNSLRLPWAPINEQKRILLVLHATDSHLHGEQVTVKKLYLLKSGVMNDLLTGRVRVPEGIAVTG